MSEPDSTSSFSSLRLSRAGRESTSLPNFVDSCCRELCRSRWPCDISRQSPQLAVCRPLSLERPVPWAEAVVSREGPVSDVMLGGFGGEQAAREARFDSCQRAACQAREMLHAKEYGDARHREFQFSGFELFRACFSQEIDALGASGLAGLFGRSRRSCGAVTIKRQRRSTGDDVQRR